MRDLELFIKFLKQANVEYKEITDRDARTLIIIGDKSLSDDSDNQSVFVHFEHGMFGCFEGWGE